MYVPFGLVISYLLAAYLDAEESSQGKESVDNLAISQYLLVSYTISLSFSLVQASDAHK